MQQRRVNRITLGALVFEGGLLALAVLLGWLLGYPPFEQVAFRWRTLALAAFATCPLLAALVWCTRTQIKPILRLYQEIQQHILPLFAGSSVFELAAISLLAGLAEESLFRGVLQSALAERLGPLPALIVASALFGIAHFITPTYVVLASVIGAYLGGVLMFSGNLLAPILVHAIYDFVALLYLGRKYNQPALNSQNPQP